LNLLNKIYCVTGDFQGCELAEGGCGYWLDDILIEDGEPWWFILYSFDLECLPYEEFNL
jgi:hypothetical protein